MWKRLLTMNTPMLLVVGSSRGVLWCRQWNTTPNQFLYGSMSLYLSLTFSILQIITIFLFK